MALKPSNRSLDPKVSDPHRITIKDSRHPFVGLPPMKLVQKRTTELSSPPAVPVIWLVWDERQPQEHVWVEARSWMEAKEKGALVLGTDKSRVDAVQRKGA